MAHQIDELPFQIGSTYGATTSTDGAKLEGREYLVEDLDYSTSVPKARAISDSIQWKRIRIVRNVSGVALLPRYLVRFSTSKYGKQVDGYVNTTAGEGYPVDEFLPTAGVANNDLFYIVVEGPAECYTSAAANAEDVFSQGSVLVALTAAASTFSTTAGRVTPQDLTGATALLANQIQNKVGVAMSESTTANSNSAKLVYIKRW